MVLVILFFQRAVHPSATQTENEIAYTVGKKRHTVTLTIQYPMFSSKEKEREQPKARTHTTYISFQTRQNTRQEQSPQIIQRLITQYRVRTVTERNLVMTAASRGFVYRQKSEREQTHIIAIIITIRATRLVRCMSAAIGALVRVAGLAIGIATASLRIRLWVFARVFLTTVHNGGVGAVSPL